MGFERGWGDTAERVLETMHLLLDILQAPDPSTLETFLGRVPMVFNVVILSPHGFFGQANVLGLPDTGGQVSHFPYTEKNSWVGYAYVVSVPPVFVSLSCFHPFILHGRFYMQVVYILDQVRALENEMLLRIKKQGLDFTPRILIVSVTFSILLLILIRLLYLIVFWVQIKLNSLLFWRLPG